MPEPVVANSAKAIAPDYVKLIRFFVIPFLESPDELKLDCEVSPSKPRIWVRLAFEGADKGRVFGRGGRNIQAIRTVLDAVASLSGYSVHLDVYGSSASHSGDGGEHREEGRSAPRRPPRKDPPRTRR